MNLENTTAAIVDFCIGLGIVARCAIYAGLAFVIVMPLYIAGSIA